MARKILTDQEKKKKKEKKILCLILLLLILLSGLFVYKQFNKKGTGSPIEVKVLDSIDEYGYSLSDKDSSLFKSEYENLKKILKADKIDESAYSTQVAKMFVIDLLSLSTKMNKYDIGGSEFYHNSKKTMFETKVMDTIYSTLQDDTYGDRKQELPLVKSIEVVSTEETKYTLGKEKINSYSVKLKWTYEKDLGYDTEGTVVVSPEDGLRWSVVDYKASLNPKYENEKK